MDSVLMLAFLSLVFFFFFSGNIFWRIYLIYRSVNCFMLQSQKKLSFQCSRSTLIQSPENLATHYRSAIKLRESCSVLLLFWIFFLRTSCSSTSVTFASQMKTSSHVIYEETVSLVQIIYSSLKLLRNWSIARESLLF